MFVNAAVNAITQLQQADITPDHPSLWFVIHNKETITAALRESELRRFGSYDVVVEPLLDNVWMVCYCVCMCVWKIYM